MSTLLIRKVSFKDISDLQKICKQTFLETYAAGNTEEDMHKYLEEEFADGKLKLELNDNDSEFYFAILDNKVIGYIKINFGESQTEIKDKKALEIQRIYVLKDFQGKRIGKALYQKACRIAKAKKGLEYLWLGVWEENPKAIQSKLLCSNKTIYVNAYYI